MSLGARAELIRPAFQLVAPLIASQAAKSFGGAHDAASAASSGMLLPAWAASVLAHYIQPVCWVVQQGRPSMAFWQGPASCQLVQHGWHLMLDVGRRLEGIALVQMLSVASCASGLVTCLF